MSFIGADGQDHKIRQLNAQVHAKDCELASVRDELRQCKEKLADEVKARQASEYQLNLDAQGRETSGKDAAGLRNEITSLKQNLFNRETSLSAANDTIKQLQKDNQGLQYELETAGSSSSDATRRLMEQKTKLEAEVKSLKQELQRRDSEDVRQKAANAKLAAESSIPAPSGIPRMKRSTTQTNLFGASPSPAPAASSRRRSVSMSNAREAELEKEVGTLKTQISGLKVRLDKADNMRMAIERGADKRVEEQKMLLEQTQDELEWYKSKGDKGKADPKELLGLKNSVEALKQTNLGLMSDLAELTVERDALKAASAALAPGAPESGEIERLNETIAALESRLQESEAAVASASSSSGGSLGSIELTREIKKLTRELKQEKLLREQAEEEREEYEQENLQYRAQLDGAAPAASPAVSSACADHLEELGRYKAAVDDAEKLHEQFNKTIEGLRGEVEAGKDRKEALGRAVAEVETLNATLAGVREELAAASKSLENKELALVEATEELDNARGVAKSHDEVLSEAREELGTARSELSEVKTALSSAIERASTSSNRVEELEAQVRDVEELQRGVDEATARVSGLEADIELLTAARNTLEIEVFGAKAERDQARSERDELSGQVQAVQESLRQVEEAKTAFAEGEATAEALRSELADVREQLDVQLGEVERLSDDLQKTAAENAKLEIRNAELDETLANRSTETESQHRQEEVFQLKDDLESANRVRRKLEVAAREKEELVREKAVEVERLEGVVGELERRVAELNKPAPAPAALAEPSHADLLYSKIERLRAERDDLRQTMSFVQHEHRFVLQASESEKVAAIEELQRVQTDLRARLAEADRGRADLGSLQEQYDAVTADMEALRSRLAEQQRVGEAANATRTELNAVQHERDALREAIAPLEEARTHLVSDLAQLRNMYTTSMSNMMRVEKELKVALMERDELRDAQMPGPAQASGDGRPESSLGAADGEARTRRHSRRQSMQDLQSSMSADNKAQIKVLERQVREEQGRVQRRNTAIEQHSRTIKKLEGEMELLRDAMDAGGEGHAEAIQDKERVVLELQTRLAAEEAGRGEVVARAAQLEEGLSNAREAAVAANEAAGARIAELTAAVAEKEAERTRLEAQVTELSARVAALTSAEEGSAARLAQLEKDALTAREALVGVQAERDSLQTQLASEVASGASRLSEMQERFTRDATEATSQRLGEVEVELESAKQRLAVVQGERDSVQAQLAAEQDSTRVEMEELFSTKHALERQVQGLTEGRAALEARVEGLALNVQGADEARQAEVQAGTEAAQKVRAEMEEQMKLVSEVRAAMVEKEAEVERLQGEKKLVQEDVERLGSRVAELDAEMLSKAAENGRLVEEVERAKEVTIERDAAVQLGAELTERVKVLEQAEADVVRINAERVELQTTVDRLEGELAGLRETIGEAASIAGERDALKATVATLEEAAQQPDFRIEALQADVARLETGSAEREAAASAVEGRLAHSAMALQAANAKVAELEASLGEAMTNAADLEGRVEDAGKAAQERDAAQAEVADLTAALSAAKARVVEFEGLVNQGRETMERNNAESKAETEALGAELGAVKARVAELDGELSAGREVLEAEKEKIAAVQKKLIVAEERAVAAEARVELVIVENQGSLDTMTKLKIELADARAAVQEVETAVLTKDAVISQLRNLNDELKTKLADLESVATPGSADAEEVAGLKETIAHLEATLEQRSAECESYDDKLSESSKMIKTLERKMQKMIRDNKKREMDDELARNTAHNVKASQPTAKDAAAPMRAAVPAAALAAPLPAPAMARATVSPRAPLPSSTPSAPLNTAKTASTTPAAPTSRVPLRHVNVLDKMQIPSFGSALTGTKRAREPDAAEGKARPADAIMLPPSERLSAKTRPIMGAGVGAGGLGLGVAQTPTRGNIFADAGKENRKYGIGATGPVEVSRATPGGQVGRITVPARNVFSPVP